MNNNTISVVFADSSHAHYAQRICDLIYESALQRGTGIAKRSPEYIAAKMTGGKAVVALDGEKLVGFSYIECWGHGDFVATSGLIVDPEYRHMGLAEQIKRRTFELARRRFPYAKLFSITTSLPVMKLNSRMGYVPVTFSELTEDEENKLNDDLNRLLDMLDERPEIRVTYFVPDKRKSGGSYQTKTGIVRIYDSYTNELVFMDKTRIAVEDMCLVEFVEERGKIQ